MKIFKWIFSHKLLLFVYLPALVGALVIGYTGYVYLSWLDDKDNALEKLAKYKRLIDRTEELREGRIYSYSQIDLSAKVVDIPTRIYDRNNEIIGEFFEQKREIVPYKSIPEWLVKAVIASEDRDFHEHNGLSYKGIFRAFVVNLINLRVVQGGSTLTQQLAKVLFTDMERELKRKIYEAFCALEIEERYDKQDILSMYLNLIYFGNGAYGVEATSKMFFGMPANKLNETECAMIVATISNPYYYSPLSKLSNSLKKTVRIMKSMVDAGYIEDKIAKYQLKRFIKKWDFTLDDLGEAQSSLIGSFLYSSYRVNRAPFFNERIRRTLMQKFGEDAVKKGGLSVYTTIDAKKQDVAVRVLREGILNQRKYHEVSADKIRNQNKADKEREKAENIEGALAALDPFTGEIISYAGGYEFSAKSQLDHAAQIRRQPGSSFKPLVYVSAFENNDITPSTLFVDEKTVFEDDYSPFNYNKKFSGKMIVREALRKSINVVAVKVLDKTGYDTVFRILKDGLGVSKSQINERFGKTLSLALGTYELSPMENCLLHSIIANGGTPLIPYGVRFVKDYNGNIVWDNEINIKESLQKRRKDIGNIIGPISCAVLISILKGVCEPGGTAYYAAKSRNIDFPIAGKTGTSANFNDAWFVGYTSALVTSVWIGNKAGAISLGQGRAGGVVAAPIWADFISSVFKDNKPGDFRVPEDGVSEQTICLDSGLVPRGEGVCPGTAVNQLFYQGSEPGEYCNLHFEE